MDKKVVFVLKGFTDLTQTQRQELIKEINKFQEGGELTRESIRKSVRDNSVTFGPAPTGCPCCGR